MPFEFPLSQFRRAAERKRERESGLMQSARCVCVCVCCTMRLCFQITRFCWHANVIECRKQGDMICALKELPFISFSFCVCSRHSLKIRNICWNVSCQLKANFGRCHINWNAKETLQIRTECGALKQHTVDGAFFSFSLLFTCSVAHFSPWTLTDKNEVNSYIFAMVDFSPRRFVF